MNNTTINNLPILFFDTHKFEKEYYAKISKNLIFFDFRLNEDTVNGIPESQIICCFVNDHLNKAVLTVLKRKKVQLICLRCAGFNQVDLKAAKELGIHITRVPEYSPYAVAEHAVGLLLNLVRKIHKAYLRVHEFNFSLDGLVGFDIHGKTIGVIGTGKIGQKFIHIMKGFGAKILAVDPYPNADLINNKVCEYTDLETLLKNSDIISLHAPLTPQTHHVLDAKAFGKIKPTAILINTSRGGLIDTKALIDALKKQTIAGAGLDVYEEEEHYFFQDLSTQVISDDNLARLVSFPNVIITSHQGFLTKEALENIANVTMDNMENYQLNRPLQNKLEPT